ncbi:MAG TPA: hypothetical protein VMV81_00815, partial [Phycisphaerae bacterium]|nr:hypothetical protein [Phycisphaerae bacterium]
MNRLSITLSVLVSCCAIAGSAVAGPHGGGGGGGRGFGGGGRGFAGARGYSGGHGYAGGRGYGGWGRYGGVGNYGGYRWGGYGGRGYCYRPYYGNWGCYRGGCYTGWYPGYYGGFGAVIGSYGWPGYYTGPTYYDAEPVVVEQQVNQGPPPPITQWTNQDLSGFAMEKFTATTGLEREHNKINVEL